MTMYYSPPYCWCDSNCARCPLQRDCPTCLTLRARREEQKQRGEDPDDPDVFMTDIRSDLTAAMDLLQKEARKRGIDLDDLPDPPEPPPGAARLQEITMQYAVSIKDLVDGLRPGEEQIHDELVGQILGNAFLLGAKAARVAGGLTEDCSCFEDHSVYRHDTVPNLLLMEHVARILNELMAELSAKMPHLCLDRYRGLRGDLHELLDPLVEGIPAAERMVFDALVAAGKAPSPFCSVG